MIDYEKLKTAIALANTYSEQQSMGVGIRIMLSVGLIHFDLEGETTVRFDGLDGLISRLKELTQPTRKYKIGDFVWLRRRGNYLPSVKIEDVENDPDDEDPYYIGSTFGDWYKEQELFPTKQSLIEAQLEYWQKMKLECIEAPFDDVIISECKHESDAEAFANAAKPGWDISCYKPFKCMHCGEFY